jgi:NADPH:quinone reductase-like Zn-dependent oxidoreductase
MITMVLATAPPAMIQNRTWGRLAHDQCVPDLLGPREVRGERSDGLDQLAVGAGDTLLIHGASGAVGTLAVQLAVRRGATVIGTASEANHKGLIALGAVPTTYGDGLVERVRALAPHGIDAVFDVAGHDALADCVELRVGTDRIVTIADVAGALQHGAVLSATASPVRSVQELVQDAREMGPVDRAELVEHSFSLASAGRADIRTDFGAALGRDDECRATVLRVGAAFDEPFGFESVQNLGGGAWRDA